MSEKLELEQLPSNGGEHAPAVNGVGDLRRLSAVPVDLSVEMGRTRMTVGETLELRQGSIITLNRMAGEPVDLLVNGTAIARGEVVVIDEQFGLRVTEVLGQPPIGAQESAPTPPPAPTPSAGTGHRRPRRRRRLKLGAASDEYRNTEPTDGNGVATPARLILQGANRHAR